MIQRLTNSLLKRARPLPGHPFLTCIHLPDVDGAVRASHHQVVICRTPLDDLDGKEVSRRQHDTLPLPETQQADRMVAGHRADAVLHPRLQRKHIRLYDNPKLQYLRTQWKVTDRLVGHKEVGVQ